MKKTKPNPEVVRLLQGNLEEIEAEVLQMVNRPQRGVVLRMARDADGEPYFWVEKLS